MLIKGLPGYNPDLKNAAGDTGDATVVANTAKASELAKAYAADKCGGDLSKCTPVVYNYANGSSTQLLLAQVLQQQWQTAFPGWNITLQGIDRSVELKTFSKLQLGWDGWGADYPDPTGLPDPALDEGRAVQPVFRRCAGGRCAGQGC